MNNPTTLVTHSWKKHFGLTPTIWSGGKLRLPVGGALVGLLWMLMVSSAQAFPDPLNLTVAFPDIVTNQLSIDYDNTSGNLALADTTSSTASYLASQGASGQTITNLGYSLNASLDPANNGVLQGGTLSILGGVPGLGIPDGSTLLSGNLDDFGFGGGVGGVGVFEFVVDVTTSDPGLNFGPTANVVLSSFDITPATFSENVAFMGTGNANNAAPGAPAVPEPSTLALLALGGVVVGLRRVRARRS